MRIPLFKRLLLLPEFVLLAATFGTFAQGGVALWTNHFGGPYGGYDQPNALICDSRGNVIVTGSIQPAYSQNRIGTVKYSGNGLPLWTNICDGTNMVGGGGNALAVDSQGQVYIAGATTVTNGGIAYSRFTTLCYSGDGVPLWTNYYAYQIQGNYAVALVLDSTGRVVVTGSSYGGQFQYMYATVAYTSTGVALWTNYYGGGLSILASYATAIAADTNGNVFVTGYSTGRTSGYDYATLKYSPTGTLLWTNRYNGPANGNDYARAIAVDIDGTVFVTGYASNSTSAYDYTTLAYSNSGTPLWTNIYDGGIGGNDYACALTLDHHGHLFVTGYSTNDTSGYDYVTIAYTTAGTPLWTNRFGGSGNGDDFPCRLAVDAAGNVFVTGYCTNINTGYDFATVAYSVTGAPLWTNMFSGPSNWTDRAYAVATDPMGNVFVTGMSMGSGQDYTTLKYSSSLPAPGFLQWQLGESGLLLQWTNGFVLQSAPVVTGPFTNVPGATSPFPVSTASPQQFFRLSSGW